MTAGRSILAGTIVPVLLCAVFAASSWAAVDQLESKSSDAKQKIEQVSDSLGQGRQELDSAKQRSAGAAAKASELAGLIATGAEKSATLDDRVAGSAANLERSRHRLKRAERLLSERLVAIYMSGSPDLLDLAMGATDFDDLASNHEYIEALQNADIRLAARVRSVRNDFADRTRDLKVAKRRVDEHTAKLAAAQAGIDAARAAAEASAARLASVNSSREGQIASLKSDITDWEKQIEQQKAAAAATEAATKAATKAATATSAESAKQEVERELGGPYSIPTYIVMCESGGNYSALNPSSGAGGAYQILPSTWAAYGGSGLPNEASKAEQDRIAAQIYADSGTSPWVCG